MIERKTENEKAESVIADLEFSKVNEEIQKFNQTLELNRFYRKEPQPANLTVIPLFMNLTDFMPNGEFSLLFDA